MTDLLDFLAEQVANNEIAWSLGTFDAIAELPLVSALAVVTGAWLVNQVIGFGALHYPVDANTILWGFAIGLAALACCASCHEISPRAPWPSPWLEPIAPTSL